jgi:Anti-sigma-K factor rskA
MLSERDVELAHPEAFDFVFGNLPSAKSIWFNRHFDSCPHCQKVVDEYSEIGQIIQSLPPHVEPQADLEDRTVAAMVAALADRRPSTDRQSDAEDQAATRVYPIPQAQPSAEPETRLHPRPIDPATPAEPADQPALAEPQARPLVTRLPVWRRRRARLAAVVAAAAAIIIAAAIVIPRLSGGLTFVIPLHATTAAERIGDGAATARATARQAGESWMVDMTVRGLKVLHGDQVYECWWARSANTNLVVSGGTFIVDNSGSATVPMTAGVDPRDFRTMEITVESPGTGALHPPILFIGQTPPDQHL